MNIEALFRANERLGIDKCYMHCGYFVWDSSSPDRVKWQETSLTPNDVYNGWSQVPAYIKDERIKE